MENINVDKCRGKSNSFYLYVVLPVFQMARMTVPHDRKNQDVDKKAESIIFISNTINTSNSTRVSNKFAFSLLFINVISIV